MAEQEQGGSDSPQTTETEKVTKQPPFYVRWMDNYLSKMKLKYGWEYAIPTPLSPDLFPEITQLNLDIWFERIPAARFVCEGMASDCWDKGFRITNPAKDFSRENSDVIYNVFENLFVPQVVKAHTLMRKDGQSALILGFNDKPMEQWDQPVDWAKAKLKWTFAIPKTQYTVMNWNFQYDNVAQGKGLVSLVPADFLVSGITGLSNLHPDRYIYLERPNVLDLSVHGESVLTPIADVLFEERNVSWSIGQGLWRAVVGLINLVYPKTGVDAAAKKTVMGSFSNIHARTVTMTPDNWKVETHQLAGTGIASAWKNNEVLLQQIAIGARVPMSVLQGAPRGAFGGSAKQEDLHDYYQTISTEQNEYCRIWINKALRTLKKTKQAELLPDDFIIDFNPIFKMSFREKAADLAGEKMADTILEILEEGTMDQKFELMKLFMSTGGLTR